MDMTIFFGCIALAAICLSNVAIVALTSRNNNGNSKTANKAVDALRTIVRKK